MVIVGIMVGGALGALSRYALTLWLQSSLSVTSYAGFPLGTLVVNVVGSFLLALVTGLGLQGFVSPVTRLAVGTGFVGALTTFSTFELESDTLLREGLFAQASLYVLGNLVLAYLALLLGRWLAYRLGGSA